MALGEHKEVHMGNISKNNCLHIHPIQRTIHHVFEPEVTKDIEMQENIQKVEEICEEEIRDKRYPNLNKTKSSNPRKAKRDVGIVIPTSIIKKFLQKYKSFIVEYLDT